MPSIDGRRLRRSRIRRDVRSGIIPHRTGYQSCEEEYLADRAFRKGYREAQEVFDDQSNKQFSIHSDGSMIYDSHKGQRICLPISRVSAALSPSHDIPIHIWINKTDDRICVINDSPVYPQQSQCTFNTTQPAAETKQQEEEPKAQSTHLTEQGHRRHSKQSTRTSSSVFPKAMDLTLFDRFTRTGMFIPNFTIASIADWVSGRVVSNRICSRPRPQTDLATPADDVRNAHRNPTPNPQSAGTPKPSARNCTVDGT